MGDWEASLYHSFSFLSLNPLGKEDCCGVHKTKGEANSQHLYRNSKVTDPNLIPQRAKWCTNLAEQIHGGYVLLLHPAMQLKRWHPVFCLMLCPSSLSPKFNSFADYFNKVGGWKKTSTGKCLKQRPWKSRGVARTVTTQRRAGKVLWNKIFAVFLELEVHKAKKVKHVLQDSQLSSTSRWERCHVTCSDQ